MTEYMTIFDNQQSTGLETVTAVHSNETMTTVLSKNCPLVIQLPITVHQNNEQTTTIDEQFRLLSRTFRARPDSKMTRLWRSLSFGIVWGLITYVLDIFSDWYLVVTYFRDGYYTWGSLTLFFILAPQFFIAFAGLMWYKPILAFKECQHGRSQPVCRTYFRLKAEGLDPLCSLRGVCYIALHVLQLGPILRYADYLYYMATAAYTGTAPSQIFWDAVNVITARLRLLESCLEAMPQLLLQMYIFITFSVVGQPFNWNFLQTAQIVSISISLVSAAAGIVMTHGDVAIRFQYLNHAVVRSCTSAHWLLCPLVHFTGRLLILAARSTTLALTFSYSVNLAVVFCTVHSVAMCVCVHYFDLGHLMGWTLCDVPGIRIRLISRVFAKMARYFILPCMYLFDYVDEMDNGNFGRRRFFPWLYYSVHLIENLLFLVVWSAFIQEFSGFGWMVTGIISSVSISGVVLLRLYCCMCTFCSNLITVAANTLSFEHFLPVHA